MKVAVALGGLLLPAAVAGWFVAGEWGAWVAAGCVIALALVLRTRLRRVVRALPLSLVVLAGIYIAIRVWAFWGAFSTAPPPTPDTLVYEATSRLSLASSSFWTGWEPWGLPLFYKALPGPTADSAPSAQWAVSVVAWLVLAAVVATFIRSRLLRALSFALVLAFSLAWVIGQWDGILLTESLSLSEAALLLAALLAVVRTPSRRNTVFVLAVSLIFAATRDASGYLAAMLVLPAAAVVWAHGRRRTALVLAAGVTLIVAMVVTTSQVERWQILMRDTIAIRVLPSQAETRFFVERGMPVMPGLTSALYDTPHPPSPFVENPSLAPLHTWLLKHGRGTLAAYMIRHPGISIGRPLRHLDTMVGLTSAPIAYVVAPGDSWDTLRTYRQPGYREPLPSWLEHIVYPGRGWEALVAMMAAVVALAIAALRRAVRAFWIVPAATMFAVIPLAVVVWDATPEAIARHALLVGVLGRLGLWLAVLFVLDAALERPSAAESHEGLIPATREKPVAVG